MATVLIIYYKQISEGYEDRERFCHHAEGGYGAARRLRSPSAPRCSRYFPSADRGRDSCDGGVSADKEHSGSHESEQHRSM